MERGGGGETGREGEGGRIALDVGRGAAPSASVSAPRNSACVKGRARRHCFMHADGRDVGERVAGQEGKKAGRGLWTSILQYLAIRCSTQSKYMIKHMYFCALSMRVLSKYYLVDLEMRAFVTHNDDVQCSCSGWPTGYG